LGSIYKRMSFGYAEPITTSKINDMIGNSDWLFQNSVTAYYDALGIVRDSGLTMRTGYIKALKTENAGVHIGSYYARPFLPGARPVVVTGLACDNYFGILHAVKGLDGRAIPDHRGFNLMLWQHRDPGGPTKFQGDQNVSYISIAPTG
jgi:hypothetical protein